MSKHLFFEVAGNRYALPYEHVKAVHSDLEASRVVGTCNWFLGVAVSEGRLIPVTDLGLFFGSVPSEGITIELDPSVALAALRVDSLFGAATLDSHHAEEKLEALENTSEPLGVTGRGSDILREFVTGELVGEQGQSHHVLDVLSLVESDRFTNIRDSVE